MQSFTALTLLWALAASVISAPVTDSSGTLPVAENVDAANMQPACPDTQTFRLCTMQNLHPTCNGRTFDNDIPAQCGSCWCE